jgi:TonB family protein
MCELFPMWPPSAAHAQPALLEICVGPAGTVSSVLVKRGTGDESLDRLVVSAVQRWLYEPQLKDGKPTAFCHPITIDYKRGKAREGAL